MILKLNSIHRKEGNLPEDIDRIGELYLVERMEVGKGAILPLVLDQHKVLLTSKVENIIDNELTIVMETVNTTYEFEVNQNKTEN